MADLPRPNFIDRDPAAVETAAIALWESISGKPLFPADPERLLINLLVYRESLLRVGIQYAAEQQLVNYATGGNLDQLGALVDTQRLAAAAATDLFTFTKLGGFLNTSISIPAGTLISTGTGVLFATNSDLILGVGIPSGQVVGTCTQVGVIGNGFAAGQINQWFSVPITGILSISNAGPSSGGIDTETDDRYRERIKLAPEQFSVAGSAGAYRYHTLEVSSTIIDASVLSPSRGQVNVYPLTTTGAPSGPLIAAVQAALSPDTVRPLTDMVTVLAPTAVNFTIEAFITLYTWADVAATEALLDAAADAYVLRLRSSLGVDIVRAQMIDALLVPGVYSVALGAPLGDTVLSRSQWANCTNVTITIAGSVEG